MARSDTGRWLVAGSLALGRCCYLVPIGRAAASGDHNSHQAKQAQAVRVESLEAVVAVAVVPEVPMAVMAVVTRSGHWHGPAA